MFYAGACVRWLTTSDRHIIRRVNLVEAYRRQFARRSWSRVYESLPPLQGVTILDLGCGPGDQAAEFVSRGAAVIGIDLLEELLIAARARNLPQCRFINADLRKPIDIGVHVDGVWAGFTAAYFTDLRSALSRWKQHVRPGGWIVLIEIDDFFGHQPLCDKTEVLLKSYVRDSLAAKRYDFYMGSKLRNQLEVSGFEIQTSFALPDPEFSFSGAADDDVLDAWEFRFEVMSLLRDHCGAEFDVVQRDFLGCLASPNHRCNATVQCCIARLPVMNS